MERGRKGKGGRRMKEEGRRKEKEGMRKLRGIKV